MAQGDRTADPGPGGVSAAELLRAVRVHLDRVHDAVLRTGCSPERAVAVVRDSALDLVDRVAAEAPRGTGQVVGEWFGDALARGRETAGPGGGRGPDAPGGPDAAADELRGPDAALASLPEPDRSAVLLRDGYDLPAAVVAAALGSTVDETQDVVARARLALPDGDAGRGSRPLTGLVVTPLPEPPRAGVLRAVEERAAYRLPAAAPAVEGVLADGAHGLVLDSVVDGGMVDEPPPRLLSPLLAVLSVVLAVLAGVGIGLLLSTADDVEPLAGADGELPPGVVLVTPQPSAPATPPSPPTVPEQRPETRVVVVPPSPLPTPTPTPSPTPTPTPTPAPTLALSPASGPNGSTVIVTGAGFAPGAQVRIDYLDTTGEPTGSSAVAVADDDGTVSTELAVQDPAAVPGPHDVVATAGDVSARATFTAQE